MTDTLIWLRALRIHNVYGSECLAVARTHIRTLIARDDPQDYVRWSEIYEILARLVLTDEAALTLQ